jgi:hypothetical protein
VLNVFVTVDTEAWPESAAWRDNRMAEDIQRDYYGHTKRGEFGTLFQADLLKKYGLKGVFFMETLFSHAVGVDHLRRMVGELQDRGHEIALHLHPEWIKRAPGLLPGREDASLMRHLSEDDQATLIARGIEQLRACGVDRVYAFRAGGYGANWDTLRALARNGVPFDSSYNACYQGSSCEMATQERLTQPVEIDGVWEFPIPFIEDYPGHYRHAQIVACSSREMEQAMRSAHRLKWHSFVIVSHSFELIKRRDLRRRLVCLPSNTVIRRFEKLCCFLADHRDLFRTSTFREIDPASIPRQPSQTPLRGAVHHTAMRMMEQLYKRVL